MANINLSVTETGLDSADRKLKKLTTTGKKTEKQTKKTEDQFKSFSKNASSAVAAIDGPLGGVASRMSAVTTLFTSGTIAMTAFAVAATAGASALYSGIAALDEYEVGLRRTEAILRATGNAAGFTAEQLKNQADELARATLTSTQEVQEAQAALLTFNRVSTDTFSRAIELSQDLAASGFGRLTDNAKQLGKALQDPITGLSALSRSGLSFTESQKDLIATLVDSNQLLEAQSIVLDAIESQVGGAGVAVAVDTLAGSYDTLGDAVEKFNVQIAKASGLSGAFMAVINQTAADLDYLTAKLDENSRVTFQSLIEQRRELQATLKELEGSTSIFGASDGAVNRVKSQLKEVESELIRIQNFEKSRQEAITAAQELARAEQVRLDKLASDDGQRLLDEENQKKLAKQAELSQKQAIADDAEFASNIEALRNNHIEQTELWQQYYTGINTIEAEANRVRLEELRATEMEIATIIQSTGNAMSSSISSGIIGLIDGSKTAKEAVLGVLSSVTNAVIQAGVDILVQKFITDSIMKAANLTTVSSQVAQNTALAGQAAFVGAASTPIIGPFIAPAAAASASAAAAAIGAPAIAAAGARFQGGTVSAGNAYNWQERGGEAFIPKVDGTVFSRNDMKSMMGGGGGGNVYITNNTPAKVEATQDDDGNTYVKISELDELVGAALSNPNSDSYQGLSSVASLQRS